MLSITNDTISQEEAGTILEQRQEEIRRRTEETQAQLEALQIKMTELKTKLYGKFKTSINLEDSEQ